MLNHRMFLSAIFLSMGSIILVSCASSIYNLPDNEKDAVISRTYSSSFLNVFSACLEVLQEDGWITTNTDKESGNITTDYKLNDNSLTFALMGQYRGKLSIRVKKIDDKKNKVTLIIQSEREKAPGSWEPDTITQGKYESMSQDFWVKLANKIQ